eukprot:11483025-Ditylum_brightwellii.AAC.1
MDPLQMLNIHRRSRNKQNKQTPCLGMGLHFKTANMVAQEKGRFHLVQFMQASRQPPVVGGIQGGGFCHTNRRKQLRVYGYQIWEKLLHAHDYGATINQYFWVTWAVPEQGSR